MLVKITEQFGINEALITAWRDCPPSLTMGKEAHVKIYMSGGACDFKCDGEERVKFLEYINGLNGHPSE